MNCQIPQFFYDYLSKHPMKRYNDCTEEDIASLSDETELRALSGA